MSFAEMMRLDVKHGIYRVPSGQEAVWLDQIMNGHSCADGAAEVELADGRWIRMLSRRTKERNVSTTLRQWLLDFKLGFPPFALVDLSRQQSGCEAAWVACGRSARAC